MGVHRHGDQARLIPSVLSVLLFAACAAPSPAPPDAPRAIEAGANKQGIHLLLDDGRNHWPEDLWPEHLRYARQAAGEWGYVTQVIRADDLDAGKWQRFMDLCAEHHLTPVLRLATAFDRELGMWIAPQADRDDTYRSAARAYARFVAGLDWPTGQHFVILGNEPNHGNEWSGVPDPAAYARYLIDVANTLHTADAGARVLNAGFDPYAPDSGGQPLPDGMVYLDEESFLDQMVAAEPEVFRHIDAWASHRYPLGPFSAGPWEQIEADGLPWQGINGYAWELWKLSTYGVEELPVLISETGWRHSESAVAASSDGANAVIDAQTAAAYLDLAINGNHGRYPAYPEEGWTPWRDDPRVIGVTPFALDGAPAEWGHSNWLVLDRNGNTTGTYPLFDVFAQP